MSMQTYTRRLFAAAIAAGTLLAGAHTAAQSAVTLTATASVKTPNKSGSQPITIRIDRFVSDADREKVLAIIKAHQPAETLRALTEHDPIGYIEVGKDKKRTPIKFAYSRPSGDGRLITIVTAEPIMFLDIDKTNKPKEGFNLALALLVLDARDSGEGELAPAAKVRIDDQGAVVTEEYGSEVVRLLKISRVN